MAKIELSSANKEPKPKQPECKTVLRATSKPGKERKIFANEPD